jgi:phospholipid/cholesterol/gamma-HCH transport system permease protein
VFNALDFGDLIPASQSKFFFGFAIGLVGCFKNIIVKTAGVGVAANSAVVYTSMLPLLLILSLFCYHYIFMIYN